MVSGSWQKFGSRKLAHPLQAERLRTLGWADYLDVQMMNSRRTLKISYWVYVISSKSCPSFIDASNRRKPPPRIQGKPPPPPQRHKIPPLGGSLTISIVPVQVHSRIHPHRSTAHPPIRSARHNVLAELQERAKLGEKSRPSDGVEHMHLEVKWEPQRDALGVMIPEEATQISPDELKVVSKVCLCCARANSRVGSW